jgi:hypothetical protein
MHNSTKQNARLKLGLLLIAASSVVFYSYQDGITGKTLKNGIGCDCHAPSPFANVSVVISGPDELKTNGTAVYTLTISGGPLVRGGTNIAVSSGTLNPISGDLRRESGELTHIAPKEPVGGSVSFEFNYTAPAAEGQQTIFANGNSVNFNGQETGDQWNFAQSKVINVVMPTSIEDESLPLSFNLYQNYPNPFNPSTKIKFSIPTEEHPFMREARGMLVTLKVYDMLGHEIATLVNEKKSPGTYEVEFAADNLTSGIYVYRLQTGNFVDTQKMVLMR